MNANMVISICNAFPAIASAIAAILICLIAHWQKQLQAQQLRLQLYERRYAIYKAFYDFCHKALAEPTEEQLHNAIRDFYSVTHDISFLLPPKYSDFIPQLSKQALELRNCSEKISNLKTLIDDESHQNHNANLIKQHEIIKWFDNQLDLLKKEFGEYLDFSNIK